MRKPAFLSQGDRIRIVSPAGKIKPEKVKSAFELLKAEGYEVIVGNHVFDNHFQFAANND